MNARDELSTVIGEQFEHPAGPNCPVCADVVRAANAILAAGYSKPRTITTEEDVEALPEGSRLYSPGTHDFWILNDLSDHGGVKVYGTGGGYTYIRDFIRQQAPMTVIYTPEESK